MQIVGAKISRKTAQPILDATYPGYKGRKITLYYVTDVTMYDTNAAGGTKNEYKAVEREGMQVSTFTAPAPWVNWVEGKTFPLPVNGIIVERSFFCGHDMGVNIYIHESHRVKELAA